MIPPLRLGLALWIGLWACSSAAAAEDQNKESAVTVRTKEGLHFNVPPDWPVEWRNGIVTPIPIEEYLDRKFSAVEKRMETLERQASSLETRLRVLEEEAKRRLQSKERAP